MLPKPRQLHRVDLIFTRLDLRALHSWAITVSRVVDRCEFRNGTRLFQGRVKQLGLIKNYAYVFAAVDNQYWRIILVYVRDRIWRRTCSFSPVIWPPRKRDSADVGIV